MAALLPCLALLGAAPQSAGAPIVVAAILSTTGAFAIIGEPERNGVRLAEREINARGGINGRPLRVEIVDEEGKPEISAQLAQQMVAKNVVAVLGGSSTATAAAVGRITQEAKIPQFYTNPTGQLWDQKGGVARYVFEAAPRNELEARVLVKLLRAQHVASIALLHDENQYGQIGARAMTDAAKAAGLTVTGDESYASLTTDVTPQLLRIKAESPGAIVIWGATQATAIAIRQIRQLGIAAKVVGSTGIVSSAFTRIAGSDGDGVASDSALNFTYPGPAQRRFLDAYHDAYHAKPPNFAAYAYDAIELIARGLAAAGGRTDGDALAAALIAMPPYAGATGTFKFSETDHNGLSESDIHPIVARNGVWFTSR